MAKPHGYVEIQTELCKGCDLCVHECPTDTLQLSSNINQTGYAFAIMVNDSCTGCTQCSWVCPESIITVFREGKKVKS
jgi:2-oxoglutarate ferredoxin oxidoreductase subunit delta